MLLHAHRTEISETVFLSPRPIKIFSTDRVDQNAGQIGDGCGGLQPSKEVIERQRLIEGGLCRNQLGQVETSKIDLPEFIDVLAQLHDHSYLDMLRNGPHPEEDAITSLAHAFAAPGVPQDTPIGRQSFERALAAAKAAYTAARKLATDTGATYALCRPPGHHAGRRFLGGYCLLNNAAIAALVLARAGQGPVTVIDLDYHVGNGTSDVLAAHPETGFVSIHAATDHAFPYQDDLKPAHPEHLYIPFATIPDESRFIQALDRALNYARKRKSQVLVISIGFDLVQNDPHGGWLFQPDFFAKIGAKLAAVGLPICFVQEGGYLLDSLADCAAHLARGFCNTETILEGVLHV